MTGDFEDALGLLRTQELLSADRYMGVDTQMFGTEVDFGFSKTKAEAFQKWNHERVLYDAVRAVRIFRPLVIAAVFSGAVTDGHGQHQVSGQIAQEVFKAAGDPNVFPELTREGILPWQPLKVYARVPFSRVTPQGLYDYATGQTVPAEFTNYVTGQKFTTEPTADVTIHEGATDPLLSTCAANPADLPASLRAANPTDCTPLSYVQFARIGLGLQRSQIGGSDRISRARPLRRRLPPLRLPRLRPQPPQPHSQPLHTTAGLPPPSTRSGTGGARARKRSPPRRCSRLHSEWQSANGIRRQSANGAPHNSPGQRPGYAATNEPSAEGAPYNPALANQPTFFDGIDTSLRGHRRLSRPQCIPPSSSATTSPVSSTASQSAQLDFEPDHPGNIAPALADALTRTDR